MLAVLAVAVVGVVGCASSERAPKTVPRVAHGKVIELRAALPAARGADRILLRFGVPKGWKGNEDKHKRLPLAAIEKPIGAEGCRLFVQIVGAPGASSGLLEPAETKGLRQIYADKRSVAVVAPGPPRGGTLSFRVYDAPGGLDLTGPGAISLGYLQITGDPAISPLQIIARGGFDGCTAKAPPYAGMDTRGAQRALIEQTSLEIRRPR